VGITHAHMATVLETFRERPDIDLVHDHLEVVGPSVLGATDGDGPPVLRTLGVVHLGVDLAAHRFRADKGEDYLVLGRVTPFKGQDVAARLCKELGMPLVMAGRSPASPPPGAVRRPHGPGQPAARLRRRPPLPGHRPAVRGRGADPLGGHGRGAAKDELVGRARPALMPISWEEPGAEGYLRRYREVLVRTGA
jgi:hypothetical protein